MPEPVTKAVLDEAVKGLIPSFKEGLSLFFVTEEAVNRLISIHDLIRSLPTDQRWTRMELNSGENNRDNELLGRIKDVVYDIEDVLDDWFTGISSKGESDTDRSRMSCCLLQEIQLLLSPRCLVVESMCYPVSNCTNAICPCLPGCLYVNQWGLRCCVSHKIKNLNGQIESINQDRSMYAPESDTTPRNGESHNLEIGSYDTSMTKGRTTEKLQLVKMVTESTTGGLQFISILGMGGTGKSTLARLVYEDPSVDEYFCSADGVGVNKFWVSVKHPFDVTETAMEIVHRLETGNVNRLELQYLDTLINRIETLVKDRKFLLVLDKVPEDNCRRSWESIVNALKRGGSGSTVLLTTRSWDAAGLGCVDSNIFQITDLPPDDIWSIIKDDTFSKWSLKDQLEEPQIRRQILGSCHGVPYFADLLRTKLNTSSHNCSDILVEWKRWKVQRFVPLLKSYHKLGQSVRRCFSYCAILPTDTWVGSDDLTKWWSVQGYIGKALVGDTAQDYFKKLSSASFLKDVDKRDGEFGSRETFKVHNLVHDFAQFVSKGECLSLEINASSQSVSDRMAELTMVRHLRLVTHSGLCESFDFKSLSKLRSLFVQYKVAATEPFNETTLYRLFIYLTRLRSLSLSNCDVRKIPMKTCCYLTHLRWLDLSRNDNLVELPEEICELYNLVTLCIDWCRKLEKFPKGMWKLVNLCHLYNYRIKGLVPKGIMQLNSLQTLSMFTVGDDKGEVGEVSSLVDLKRCLGKLRGFLCFSRLRYVTNVSNVEELHLENMTLIKVVELRFEEGEEEEVLISHGGQPMDHDEKILNALRPLTELENTRMVQDEKILDALRPSTKLEELRIVCYRGSSIPSWIKSLKYLTKLKLSHCINCNELPSLGNLEILEYLELRSMNAVTELKREFLGMPGTEAFPNLKKLVFKSMVMWKGWDDDSKELLAKGETKMMPRLRELNIDECPLLNLSDQFLVMLKQKIESVKPSASQ